MFTSLRWVMLKITMIIKVLFAQVLSPITSQVLGNATIEVTKNKETITGLKVRGILHPSSWKLILRCQTRVLSGLSMAVTKNEESPDQFILETSLSEKLSSKYQVNTTAAVQHRNVLFWLENKVLYEKSIFVCCWENLAFIQNVFDTNLQWMNRIQTFMFNPTILDNSWMEMLNLFHDIDQRIGLFWLPSIWSSLPTMDDELLIYLLAQFSLQLILLPKEILFPPSLPTIT